MEAYGILSNKHRSSLLNMLLLAVLISCSGCMTYINKDGPYYGKIVDKETRQPLEGVVVVGDWGAAQWGSTSYYDTYETVTDKEGNFTIPGQGVQFFSDLTELQLFGLKAGYQDIEGYMWTEAVQLALGKEGERIIIGLKKLSMEERRRRSISMPLHAPKKKIKLLRRENNKEMIEIGMPQNTIIPEE
jgi:hypothetical protein